MYRALSWLLVLGVCLAVLPVQATIGSRKIDQTNDTVSTSNVGSIVGSLTGDVSIEAAEDEGKNSLTTATLTSRDLQNRSEYDAEGFSIGGGLGFNADLGLGENATPQGSTKKGDDGKIVTGKTSVTAGNTFGFGSDSDNDESVTKSEINTANITITDEEGQQALTGRTGEETIALIHTDTTTGTAEANSGALENNFDRAEVEGEIGLQIAVTQQFSQNVQYVQRQIREEESTLREAAKKTEDAGKAARLLEKADDLQKTQVLINMVAGGLLSPADSAGGILASTLAPGISYEIGQYFKEQGAEGSAAHILAHAILGGAVAAAGGNDALSGALAAGGAEALAPVLASYLYDKSPNELTPEQKETIVNIAGLAGNVIGGTVGNGASDIAAAGQAAQVAVENNFLSAAKQKKLDALRKKVQEKTLTVEEAEELVALDKLDQVSDAILRLWRKSPEQLTSNEQEWLRNYLVAYGREQLAAGYSLEWVKADMASLLSGEPVVRPINYTYPFALGSEQQSAYLKLMEAAGSKPSGLLDSLLWTRTKEAGELAYDKAGGILRINAYHENWAQVGDPALAMLAWPVGLAHGGYTLGQGVGAALDGQYGKATEDLLLGVVETLGAGSYGVVSKIPAIGAAGQVVAKKGMGIRTAEGIMYNGLTGPGPLGDTALNFRSATYTQKVLATDLVLYRAYGGEARNLGPYWSRVKPTGPLQVRLDSALLPEWGNTATQTSIIRVPAGTTIYEGVVASQSTPTLFLLGGGNQIYIPKVDPKWLISK